MNDVLYLAWRYLWHHRIKTVVLLASITLILYAPAGLRVLVQQSRDHLMTRADVTPLVVGAKGSPLELVLNTLYFREETPPVIPHATAAAVRGSGYARAIPLYARFRARTAPIVGTTLEYFTFRNLRLARGKPLMRLGDCVAGARAAENLSLAPDGTIISSPENVMDLAGVYPLKMRVAGILAPTGTADDEALFVDLKTAWLIEGLAHGHDDLDQPEAAEGVLQREGNRIVANAAVRQFNEVTDENIDSFHHHGDTGAFPITAVIAIPRDARSSALLRGRYEDPSGPFQIRRPAAVMAGLFDTVLTIEGFVRAALFTVGAATLGAATLVFLLSLRLRRQEIETLANIGGTRGRVAAVCASEMIVILLTSIGLGGLLTVATYLSSPMLIRMMIQ